MLEPSTLQTTVKLAQTKPKETQATNNTLSNLTIIYYTETTDEQNRFDHDKHNP
jgi:hypothetical protein